MNFQPLIKLLESSPLPTNYYRFSSGRGRSQAFGLIKQRTNQYAGSAMNYKRMDLFQEILEISKHLPASFIWDSVQLNQNYQTTKHKDKGNRGLSVIVAFGDYTGGELVLVNEDGEVSHDIKNKMLFFDGVNTEHYTKPFEGNRYSLVFYKVDRDFVEVPTWSFRKDGDQTYLVETLNHQSIVYDKNGEKVKDDTGLFLKKKQRSPTLRVLAEIKS